MIPAENPYEAPKALPTRTKPPSRLMPVIDWCLKWLLICPVLIISLTWLFRQQEMRGAALLGSLIAGAWNASETIKGPGRGRWIAACLIAQAALYAGLVMWW